jgi:hypothetical protein
MTTTDTSGTDEVTIDERDDAIDTDDAVEMDPRIEARRDEVRREYAQKRLRILVIVAVVVVVLVGTYLVVESPFLDVDRVEVNGAVHVTPKQVRRAAAIDEGRALLRVDLDNVARRVEALPWVASASVHRDLPGTLRIDVHEARPLAFVRANGRVAVIGPGDRVVALTREPPAGAIEITGVRRVPDRDETMSPAGTSRRGRARHGGGAPRRRVAPAREVRRRGRGDAHVQRRAVRVHRRVGADRPRFEALNGACARRRAHRPMFEYRGSLVYCLDERHRLT